MEISADCNECQEKDEKDEEDEGVCSTQCSNASYTLIVFPMFSWTEMYDSMARVSLSTIASGGSSVPSPVSSRIVLISAQFNEIRGQARVSAQNMFCILLG